MQQDLLTLDNSRKSQLDSNIKKMLEGGASNDDVMSYASDFKNKFGVKKKDDLQSDSTNGSEPLPIGLDRFRSQVPTKTPSVLTPKGKVEYQEQVKAFKPQEIAKEGQPKPPKKADGGGATAFMADLNRFNSSIFKTPRLLYDAASSITDAALQALNLQQDESNYDDIVAASGYTSPLSVLDRLGDYYAGKSNQYTQRQEKFDKGIIDSFTSGDIKGGGKQLWNNIAGSIPSMVGMAVTGGAGNIAKLGYAKKTLASALPFISGRNAELSQDESIPKPVRVANSVLNGYSEVIFDQSFGATAMINKVIGDVFKNEGRDAAVKVAKDFTKGFATEAIKKIQPFTGTIKGAVEEMSTTLSQNIVDKYTINPDKDLMEGVLDAGLVGGVMTGSIGSIGTVAYSSSQKKKAVDLMKQREEIVGDLDNDNLPDDVKEDLSDKLSKIDESINKIDDDNEIVISKLSDEDKTVLKQKESKIQSIEQALQDESLSETAKETLADRLLKEQDSVDEILIKTKQEDAVQVETAGQVPVLTEATVGEEVEQGKPQAKPKVVAEEGVKAEEVTPAQKVKQLRAEEQAELKAAIPNADQYLTDGKVDGKKLTDPKDKKAFKKIYDKYNILITPRLKEAKADAVITPDNSSNYANMTEDDKGNFVFFHVGNKGYKTIKTGTGGSIVTSREESAALSKVGGLAMYYTGPEQIERQSASGARYAVKVPKEKVYDFNTDKLNFIEEAEARHDAENPGKAFDLNSQLAYVTKIAGENGFDMVVAQWKDMTRAQTTKELTPVDVQESGGSSFSEKYEDNRKKGFESVIPVSKSKKLADVYNDIYKIRNKEQRYDDLYRLYAESDKLSQDEITKLISESDLPQEIKDKYNEALEFKQESRRSQQTKSKEEVVVSGVNYTVPTLEEQSLLKEQRTEKSYFDAKVDELPSSQLTSEQVDDILSNGNFGILTGQNPMGNPVPDSVNNKLNKKAKEWLKDKGYEFFEVAGKYGQTEGSLLVPGLSIEDALAFAKEFNQDSVITNDGLIYQDGSMNQRVKEDDSFTVDVSDPKTDFASAIKLSDGSVKGFKIGLNLDEKVPFKQESEQSIDIDKISSNTGIKAKNLRDLYNINRKIFSQDRIKSLASAIVMDRMIGAMAKRAGVSKGQIYNRIYFKKATSGEIKSLDNNSSVLFQANYSDDKTGITFSYDKNTDKFNNLKKEGYITDDKNINDFSGQYIVFHKPDYAFSGDILKNGKIIVEGQGGIYYPIKFHEDGLVWAASAERTASAFANRLNESARLSPDGKVRLALVSSLNEKVLSSYNAASGIVDVLSSKVFDEKFGLNEAIIKSALIESANSELGTNITNDKSLKEVVSIIKQKLEPENIGSIDKRKNFIYFGKNNLLAKIAENIKDTKNIEDLVSFFGDGIANKDFVGKRTGKLSRANLVQAFSYMFNEPMLRDVKDSDLTYAVIEVPASKDGGDVVTYEKNESHKSYPYSIIIKDKSAKTTLNILSETSKWNESAIDPLTNKTVAKDRMLNLLDTRSGVSNKPLMISKPKQVDINWEVSKEGKGDPSISSRNPIVEEAAKKLKEGKITNEEYRATVSENSPIGPITRFFEPATDEQIKRAFEVATKKDTQAELINEPIANGTRVASRLDIPSYNFNNTWVVAVHDGSVKYGKIKSYRSVAKIKNVVFGTDPKAGLNIAAKVVSKTTIARMYGDWVEYEGKNSAEKAKNAKAEIESIVNDKNWVQVGMNPFRHSYFYDRNSDIGRPILAAEEVVQIGGLVYAKNPQYGNWTDEAFAVRDSFDSAGNEIRFQDKMGAIITQDSNAIIYALTDPNVSTPLHEMAHAFEHYLTLDERKDVLGWANTNTWTKETSEKFARGFEKYLSEGKAPTPLLQKIFNKFKEWLTDIYNGIVDSEIDIELNEKMRSIYSSMLGEDKVVTKLNESNVENAIELLDEIEDNKRKAERASSKRKADLEQKISEAETELGKIQEEAKIVKVINDNFDKIKKDLKEQGLLNVKC
jgi:hypothetical protein